MSKKIAIIGGGFTGLACGVELIDRGCEVTIFEAGNRCGGLAQGFRSDDWKWDLENFYHHIFTSDKDIIHLAKKVRAKLFFKVPITSSLFHLSEVQLDSPVSLIKFSGISFWSRIQMGVGLAVLRVIPNGLFLEKFKAVEVLPKLLGKEAYKAIWERLLIAKFGPYKDEVNMAWFWSRIAKRSRKLGYFEGGFQELANKIQAYIESKSGKILVNTPAKEIEKTNDGLVKINGEEFNAVVVTTPAAVIKDLVSDINFPKLDYLWGQTLVLEASKKMIKSYWLNILEDNWPFLVLVEHTNFIDKKNYGGKRIIYLGNYLPDGHKQLKMTKEQLLKLYLPYLKKINKHFKKDMIMNSFLFRKPYAQPVFPVNFSYKIPPMKTKVKGVYLANMSMVYPYDRGSNYAVKMGKDVAKLVVKNIK